MRRNLVNQPAPAGADSQAAYTLRHGAPVTVTDWEDESRFRRPEILTELHVRSGLAVSIEGRESPFGVLALHSTGAREFKPGDVDFVQSLANVLGDSVERQLADDNIRHRALHDPLTGLPNRILFLDRLQQALERQRRRRSMTAILVLDLDRFKLVNDSLGHQIGDELLAAAAPRLKQAVRSSDTVARFGGDEFGILLEEIADERDAIDMAQRVAGVFARPFVLEGNEHFVTTSTGITLAQGGEAPDDLIRDADTAMNQAKERGGSRPTTSSRWPRRRPDRADRPLGPAPGVPPGGHLVSRPARRGADHHVSESLRRPGGQPGTGRHRP